MSLTRAIDYACRGALDRLGGGEDVPRLVDFCIEHNYARDAIDYRLEFVAGEQRWRVQDRHYRDRFSRRDRREDGRRAPEIWAEAYTDFYAGRILQGVRMVQVHSREPDSRFWDLSRQLDEFEHRVRTQGGFRLEEERELSPDPWLDEPAVASTAASRPLVMPQWARRFIDLIDYCNSVARCPIDMADIHRCMRMLTQAPGLERRRDAYQDVRYERGPAAVSIGSLTPDMIRRAEYISDPVFLWFGADRPWFNTPDPKAIARGHQLLMDNLTPAQRETYTTKKYFDVTAKSGNVYRIKAERQLNIFRIEKGREVEKLCFLPQGGLCVGDTNLAQKIMLENDEEGARKIANKWNLIGGPGAGDYGD